MDVGARETPPCFTQQKNKTVNKNLLLRVMCKSVTRKSGFMLISDIFVLLVFSPPGHMTDPDSFGNFFPPRAITGKITRRKSCLQTNELGFKTKPLTVPRLGPSIPLDFSLL